MIRRGLVLVILFSMMLHCASRVGFLSYLYEQRHEIAYALGLIVEVPIAVCSSDYDFNSGLSIASAEHGSAIPHAFPVAQEINLFFVSNTTTLPGANETGIDKAAAPVVVEVLHGCLPSIFHPPLQLI